MALEIEKKTEKNANQIMEWLHQNLQPALDRKVGGQNLKVTFFDDEKRIEISNKKIKGEIVVKDGFLRGELKLPLLYRAFGSTIKSAVNDILRAL